LSLAILDRRYGRVEQAIEHLLSAIKLQPYMAGARSELASIYDSIGMDGTEIRRLRAEEADLVERDSTLSPDNAAIFYQLGMLRYLLGEYDKAEAALRAASEKAPKNYQFKWALALLLEKRYEQTGDEAIFNQAVELLRQLNELDPGDSRAQQTLMSLMEKRRVREGGAEEGALQPSP
jgi:Flp pilus assembly protein TadD